MKESLTPPDVQALLLDIEGTTTPVSFVYDVLVPYAREHVADFLKRHHDDPEVDEDLDSLYAEHARDREGGLAPPPWPEGPHRGKSGPIVAYVTWLMDQDRKSTGLKSLQGRIWKEGYRQGSLRGQVYPDVPPAFDRWTRQRRDICIYSSGSVQAQKLLFAHTDYGDLTSHLRAYFDTRTGPKKDSRSYRLIAQAVSLSPDAVFFLSDSLEELDAAQTSGMKTALVAREGHPAPPATHPVLTTFSQVFP